MSGSATPAVPVVDLARIQDTYHELKQMQVRLDSNPIEYGPQRFNNRIAGVRAMLNRVDQIFLQLSEDLHLFKRVTNAKRTFYEFEKRDLMVNDPKCRVGRSQGEREALADVQLRPSLEQLADLESKIQDLETLMISVKSKRTDLKDAQGRMRDQMKLIEHDLNMGARWGNSSPPSMREMADVISRVDEGLGIVIAGSQDDGDEGSTLAESDVPDLVENFTKPALKRRFEHLTDSEDSAATEPREDDVLKLDGDAEMPEGGSTSEEVDDFLDSFDAENGEADEAENGEADEAESSDMAAPEIDDLISILVDE